MKYLVRAATLALTVVPVALLAQDARFQPPGQIPNGQGEGVAQSTVLYPEMRFPIERGPAFANSQVYGHGGQYGPGGGQCDPANYSYPWQDNFCEKRGHANLLCKTGKGHQGQDIRPATCKANMYWAVAVEDGVIAQIGTFSVTLQGRSGATYRYLHLNMKNLAARMLDPIAKGERIGQVSDTFKNGAPTTRHLHFEIIDAYRVGNRTVATFLPPYSSLVAAYKKLPPDQQK